MPINTVNILEIRKLHKCNWSAVTSFLWRPLFHSADRRLLFSEPLEMLMCLKAANKICILHFLIVFVVNSCIKERLCILQPLKWTRYSVGLPLLGGQYCRVQVLFSTRIDRFQGIQIATETGQTKLVRGFPSGFVEKCNYRFASKIPLCFIDSAVVGERLCSPSAFLISDFPVARNVTVRSLTIKFPEWTLKAHYLYICRQNIFISLKIVPLR